MPLSLFVTLLCLTCIVHPYSTPFNLSLANTTFNGVASPDVSGYSVSSAGDFNNDGFADILIGAYQADPNGNTDAGETYLIFGTNQPLGSKFNLSSIIGTNGIIFDGIDPFDSFGYSVSSAGDFNNDGFDDILIGSPDADPNSNNAAGKTFLIFGTNQLFSSHFNLSSLDGTNGILFNGIDANDYSGWSVSSAGDFNNDGFDDILIGSPDADPNGNNAAGETYLIFGTNQPFSSQFNLSSINGTNGIIFSGTASVDYSGYSVSSAGDFNNDGFADILIGATYADPNGNNAAGKSYLIFGTNQPFSSQFNLSSINGTNGIVFNGINANDNSGYSVSSAGDFNNDGFADILIGAFSADPNGISAAGETYLIFGTDQLLGSQFNLSLINGTNGIIFNGIDANDNSGISVSSAGDFNNDGFDDILIGAYLADPNGKSDAGETYLIYGTNQPLGSQFNLSSLDGTNGIIFEGLADNDYSGHSVSSAGDFNNDGFDNVLIGAYQASPNGQTTSGETYLIFSEYFSSKKEETVSVAIIHTLSCLVLCLCVLLF